MGAGHGKEADRSADLPNLSSLSTFQSYAIGYGIDEQIFPTLNSLPLSGAGANEVLTALEVKGVVNRKYLYVASEDKEKNCTKNGIKRTFQRHAIEVGQNGLLVLQFSGHGSIGHGTEWWLIPSDYEYRYDSATRMHSHENYITASDLSKWISEIKCEARYILIILDCCYAEGIDKDFSTKCLKLKHDMDIYFLSSCTEMDKSIAAKPLGVPIYSYFLSKFIPKYAGEGCSLPLGRIVPDCEACCFYLSSLYTEYKGSDPPKMKIMRPQHSSRHIAVDGNIERFHFIKRLYTDDSELDDREVELDQTSRDFLRTSHGALTELSNRNMLDGKVITTAFCFIMYSIASYEQAADMEKIKNTNLFVNAFLEVLSTFDMILGDIQLDKDAFKEIFLFYFRSMSDNGINIEPMLKPLLREYKLKFILNNWEALLSNSRRIAADSEDLESLPSSQTDSDLLKSLVSSGM